LVGGIVDALARFGDLPADHCHGFVALHHDRLRGNTQDSLVLRNDAYTEVLRQMKNRACRRGAIAPKAATGINH